MLIIILLIIVVVLVVLALAARSSGRFGSSRWREERHVSEDGRHVVETTEFD